MQVSIRNVAGIASADISIDHGVTLVSGRNYAGKSTILKMTGAALCGVAIPTSQLQKKDARAMVRRGAKAGKVEITEEGGDVSVAYPACEVQSHGRAPTASTIAVGRADLTAMDERERAKLLVDLLKTDPSQDDLAKALRDVGIAAELLDKVTATAWDLVEQHGWNGAAVKAQEAGAMLKGRWQQLAGEAWGSDKARDWRPAGVAAIVFNADRAGLEKMIAARRATVDELVGAGAVGAEEVTRLKEAAAQLPALTEAAAAALAAHDAAAAAANQAKAERDALPSPEHDNGQPCPHCENHVVVRPDHASGRGYTLRKVEKVAAGELAKRRDAVAAADGKLAQLNGALGTAQRAMMEANSAKAAAERDAQKMQGVAHSPAPDNSAKIAEARGELERAEANLKAFDAKLEADGINASIGRTLAVVDALRPDGIRKAKLVNVLESFNAGPLGELTEAAGWKDVTVTPDLAIEYAATPLFLCSESEQWRARAVLRIAIAKLQRAPIVILDSADILDNPGRNGLFGMLVKLWNETKIPSLVAMTIDAPPGSQVDPKTLVPDLAARGLGCSYWISEGISTPLGETAAKAA